MNFNLITRLFGSKSRIEMPLMDLSLTNYVCLCLQAIRILAVLSLFILLIGSFYIDFAIFFSPPSFLKLSSGLLTFPYANQIVILLPLSLFLLSFLYKPKKLLYSFILGLLSGSSLFLTFHSFKFFLSGNETSVYLFRVFKLIRRYSVEFKFEEFKRVFYSLLETSADFFTYKAKILDLARNSFPSLDSLNSLSLGEVRESASALVSALYAKALTLDNKLLISENKGGIIHFISEHKTAIIVTTIVTIATVALVYYWIVPAIVTWAKTTADEAAETAAKKATEAVTAAATEARNIANAKVESLTSVVTDLQNKLANSDQGVHQIVLKLAKEIDTINLENHKHGLKIDDFKVDLQAFRLYIINEFPEEIRLLTNRLDGYKDLFKNIRENFITVNTHFASINKTLVDLRNENTFHNKSIQFLAENTFPEVLNKLNAGSVYADYMKETLQMDLAPEDKVLADIISFLFKGLYDSYTNNNNNNA
jgi:hypothetical protein